MSEIVTRKYLGLKFSIFKDEDLFREIGSTIRSNRKKIIFGYSLSILPKFREYPEMYTYSDQFDIFLSDGRGIYNLFRKLGFELDSNISIPRFVLELLKYADKNQHSVLLLGATKEQNKLAVDNIQKQYPGIPSCTGIDGYFSKDDHDDIIAKINEQKPDILLIGISSPIKETIAINWKDKLDTNIIVPCGGVIDVLAGYKKITPNWIKSLGLAWFYRFIQEPVRLFKPVFMNVVNIMMFLVPVVVYNVKIRKNREFSIPHFYNKELD